MIDESEMGIDDPMFLVFVSTTWSENIDDGVSHW